MSASNGITITWLGHAATTIDTPDGTKILIDPWVQGNPSTPDALKSIENLDLVLITHGHSDHMGDAVEIARSTRAHVIANFEITQYLGSKGIENTTGMNIGGTVQWKGSRISMVNAIHSSGISEGDSIAYGGSASGFVIEFENDFVLYHAGDTDVFEDMKLIGDMYSPDVAMLPIGGHFTMGPTGAARAAGMLDVAAVIPIHYGTFPALTGTPAELENALRKASDVKVVALQPGQSVDQEDLV